jgi:tRNA pseudouridine38-40 synthase
VWVGKNLSDRAGFLVRFGYDGKPFFGLQPQPGIATAGGALSARLHAAAAPYAAKGLAFAARTDRGVHADCNVATFYLRDADDDAIARMLVAPTVPRDDHLRTVRVERVPPTVHARGISRGKLYRYRLIDNAETHIASDDETRGGVWHVAPALDVDVMQRAANQFIGTHDFSSYRGGGCTQASAEKTMTRFDVSRDPSTRIITIDIEGNAFLRHMVRNLVGHLAAIAGGYRSDDIADVLQARHRQAASICAPPGGLTLVEVYVGTW